jgi:lipopolysaccharide export system permease protein
MNRIHRHIFANVVLTCGAAVGMFAFVLMIGSALKDLLGHVLAGQLAPDTVVRLIGLTIPVVVSYALPMGMLSGVLLVLGRMSSDREVTALRASGLSMAWLSAPILFFALLGVGLSVLINFEFMPRAKVAYERELAQAVQQNPLSFITPKTFIRDFPGIVIYAGEKNGAQLRDFWLWELDAQNRVKRFARGIFGCGSSMPRTGSSASPGPMPGGSISTPSTTSWCSRSSTRRRRRGTPRTPRTSAGRRARRRGSRRPSTFRWAGWRGPRR